MTAWFAVIVDGRLDGESLKETREEADVYFAEWYPDAAEYLVKGWQSARQCIVDVRVVDIFEATYEAVE